ncbi:hypothetical protein IV203_019988 [Nitzschia inconspicua]|uniref:Uncharacterized protein n=1 Tax=Nitzschia inconspicua TaxID=303405 RepID=A0A9K3M0J4_9STRA|nr:hypothetical protein IV203_019988 [Nitzschia inconspicua]
MSNKAAAVLETPRRKGRMTLSNVLLVLGTSIVTMCLQNFVHYTIRMQNGDSPITSFGCQLEDREVSTKHEKTMVPLVHSSKQQPSFNKEQKQRRLVTVFSSGCSPSQDWQSQALLYSHQQQKIPGELVRLLSCNNPDYPLPQTSYSKYRVVRTPDFSIYQGDDYSARNRPAGMEYWLNGFSHDDPNPPSGNDTIIMGVDPDMIFLHSDALEPLMRMVRPGYGVATAYEIGSEWVERKIEWRDFWCPPTNQKRKNETNQQLSCQPPTPSSEYHQSFGHPQLMTAEDTKRQAKVWTIVTNDIRRGHKGWLAEMYSNVIAMRRANISVSVRDIMVSFPMQVQGREPWHSLQWYSPKPQKHIAPFMFIAHYCNQYQLGNFVFDKRNFEFWKNVDLNNCTASPAEVWIPPSVDGKTQDMIARLKYNESLLRGQKNVKEQPFITVLARNGWFIDKVYSVVHEAMGAYYEEFCNHGSS